MTRVTRSRQAASSLGENNVKGATKRTTITGAVTKKIIGKTRSNVKKASNQDENAVPVSQIKKVSNAMGTRSKGPVLGSKQPAKKDELPHSTVLGMKSPALRDRTNTTNEPVKADTGSKLPDKITLAESKKSNVKRTTRNTKKQSVASKDILSMSIEKYTVKLPRAQTRTRSRNSLSQNENLPQRKKGTKKASEKKDINENLDKSQEQLSSEESKSGTVLAAKKAMKRKNMSMEDVERLLNEDDDDDDDEDVAGQETSDNEEEGSIHEENEEKVEHKTKKFFKHKGIEEETKPAAPIKKNPVKNIKSRAAKRVKNNDSTFSPKVDDQRQSTKPENKKLRTRAVKNYCETSRLSNSKDEAKTGKPVEDDHKPIYNTIKLTEEEKKGEPDEIYEFEASQDQDDDGQKGKKRKKTVKRPAVKRAKKARNLPFGFAPQPKKKPAKAANKNVLSKVDNVNKVNTNAVLGEKKVYNAVNAKTATVTDNVETNYKVPDDLPQIGDSAFEEAPTIKIVSDQKLEGNSKYRLTTTPAQKSSATGMKVFAAQNDSSSQPNQLKKMANHSLIRESMSPIKKLTVEFDNGSPWRAPVIDTFTRVRRVVQSTPQVKRQVALHEQKPLGHIAELNQKSIGSEETIHLSSAANKDTENKERSLEDMTTIKQDETRKFGTVISNLSSSKSTNTTASSNNSATQKSPAQGTSLQSITVPSNQQSPLKAISPPSADPNLPVNYKTLDIDDPNISFDNKENISPTSSPKKKIVAPSPFRFEKIRSSKRLAAITSSSKSPEKVSPTKVQEPEPEAGPSRIDQPKPTVMKQTNLNNFLNLVDTPESTNISTPHGIFDDVCSTPVSGKKPRKFVEEANIENAFGFDDFDCDDASNIENAPAVKIATEADVKKSVKGKLFPKARVKSSVPSRISENTVKKTLLKDVLKKKVVEKAPEFLQEVDEDSDSSGKNNENDDNDQVVPYHKETEKEKKKVMLDAISFSDTFDVLSENGEEIEAKVPQEIPLFVDLEPAHFTEPPRRSYNKKKRNVCFDTDRYKSSDDDEEYGKKKAKKKKPKESHLKKEEKKRMEEWVKNVNKTFDEIEDFDLVVE